LGIGHKFIVGIVLGIFITGLTMAEQKAFAGFITIDNDLPAATVGSWAVNVLDAGESRDAFLTANRVGSADVIVQSEIVFDYFTFIDIGTTQFQLSSTTTSVGAISGDDEITSSGNFVGSNGNIIDWTAVSSIANASPIMVNVFTFTAQTGTLGTLQVFQYMDEDVEGVGDDVFFTRGSAVATDLELFTLDNNEEYGVSHSGALTLGQGLVNSGFDGWAGDVFNFMKPRIGSGLQTVSPTGVIEGFLAAVAFNHPTFGPSFGPIDVVSTLAWTAEPSATTAQVLTTLGGVPDVSTVQCGNMIVEPGEACDDGNGDNTDFCKNDCTFNICGDGFIFVGMEACDPQPPGSLPTLTCDITCQLIPICGDGIINQPTEQCDPFPPGSLPTADCDINCGNIIQPICVNDIDCDDGQFCTLDTCVAGVCVFNPNPVPACERVGGEFIGVDTTALLVAGFQANALWLLPAITAIGIAAVVIRRIH